MVRDLVLKCLLLLFLAAVLPANENAIRRRFEYKHSFKGPHLIQEDLTVPFWTLLGDTVAGDDQIRLVPSIRDKKGLAQSHYPFPHQNWEVEVHIRVEGRGKVGADGLAIWYTSAPPELGSVFGSNNHWTGLGVLLDSFDNDSKLDNPLISVVYNDGTMEFQHGNDGINQYSGSCRFDFRNKPYPVRIKLTYYQEVLTVSYTSGNLPGDDFVTCTTVENIVIPPNYYFGVSAATGGLADDHDVLKFLTWSISDKNMTEESEGLQEDQRQELMDDYEKNLEDYNRMQDEYKSENPDSYQEQRSPEDLYGGAATQELRSVFEIQSAIKKEIRNLAEVVGHMLNQQNNLYEKLDNANIGATADGQPPAGADDNAKKYHIDNVLNMQRETYDQVKGMRETLGRFEQIMNNMAVQLQQRPKIEGGSNTGTQNSYEVVQQQQAVNEKLHRIQNDLTVMMQRQPPTPKLVCPEPEMPNCISIGVFVAVAVVQVIILIIYHSTRTSREDAAKKFF
uniref:Putative mannose-specific lectin n=1 Tax=Polyandrocarpa misakiensis TaxID=7723 RepID=Q9GR90_POLMI|nr:putative mannose-specific lectin [Polyandrocarpa misakiensis]